MGVLFVVLVQLTMPKTRDHWYTPKDYPNQILCIDKIEVFGYDYVFNDSVIMGVYYENSQLYGNNPDEALEKQLKVGDCLAFTSHPEDTVFLIDHATSDII